METIDYKFHWNKAYGSKPVENLGWFETDVAPTLKLVKKSTLSSSARILIVGAGSTTLVDELLAKNYTGIIASDISEISLESLKKRIGKAYKKVEWVVDDLTMPTKLNILKPVDLWIDRAVLHFFVEEKDRYAYFELLHKLVLPGGYALFAEFALDGATKCSGLPVHRYSNEMFDDHLGAGFELVDTFNHEYTMPSGDKRPYIYSLYRRVA